MIRLTTQKLISLVLAAICLANALILSAAFMDLLELQIDEGVRAMYEPDSPPPPMPRMSTIIGVGIGTAVSFTLCILFAARFARGRRDMPETKD